MGGEEKRQRQTELDGRVKEIGSFLSLGGFLTLIFTSRLNKIFSEVKKSQLIHLCLNLAYFGARTSLIQEFGHSLGTKCPRSGQFRRIREDGIQGRKAVTH
jgi:hypothetical protein